MFCQVLFVFFFYFSDIIAESASSNKDKAWIERHLYVKKDLIN